MVYRHQSSGRHCSVSNHFMNQCLPNINFDHREEITVNLNQNMEIFVPENAFQTVVCIMAAVLLRPQCIHRAISIVACKPRRLIMGCQQLFQGIPWLSILATHVTRGTPRDSSYLWTVSPKGHLSTPTQCAGHVNEWICNLHLGLLSLVEIYL